ncbi:MAG: hypothetical protein ACTSU5_11105 [Promethearchaeota archaeon]
MKASNLPGVLYVDLSERTFVKKERKELFNEWLGGAGVAINLLEEE